MKRITPLILTFLLLTPLTVAQDLDFRVEGTCQNYNVTVLATDFTPGIYDVKVDVHSQGQRVGEIYDPAEGWKSTIYYLDGALQVEQNNNSPQRNVTVEITAQTRNNITMYARLRRNDKTWTSQEKTITQNCPEPEPISPAKFFLAALAAVLLILVGVTVYKKNLLA